jgi:putative transposase
MNWLAFYSATQLHSRLGYVSPMQFEKNWLAEQARRAA